MCIYFNCGFFQRFFYVGTVNEITGGHCGMKTQIDLVVRDAANFKAAVTGDVIQINRKYKPAIDCRFQGMIVQCINALPKFDDSSESIYRRLMVIPFEKCFYRTGTQVHQRRLSKS